MDSHIHFSGHNEFVNNSMPKEKYSGGGLLLLNSSTVFMGSVVFRNGTAQAGGGLVIVISKVHFHGSVSFTFNSAVDGGALCLDTESTLNITNVTTIEHNRAQYGGGLYMGAQST